MSTNMQNVSARWVGRRIGRLTVVSISPGQAVCVCKCGTIRSYIRNNLRSGHTRSCGCLHAESIRRPRREVTEKWLIQCASRNDNGCLIWQRTGDEYGRLRVGRNKQRRNGPIPHGMCVLHICDTPRCIEPSHLFLGTRADNNADRDRKGRHVALSGEASSSTKLTERDVREIRMLASNKSQTELARQFHVTQGAIWRIVHRRTWRHIDLGTP